MEPRVFYKAVRPDGTDFYTGAVQWAPPRGHEGEWEVAHPTSLESVRGTPSTHLCVSSAKADCEGLRWPCRLLVVEPADDTHAYQAGNKYAGLRYRVVGERPAHEALGPQGVHMVALMAQLRGAALVPHVPLRSAVLSVVAGSASHRARASALTVAWSRGRAAARYAAWDVVWDLVDPAYRVVALDAVCALVVRDLVSIEDYDILTMPLRRVGISVHPNDASAARGDR